MSLVIHYEKGRLIKAEQKYIRTVPSPIYAAKDGKTFVMGEVFDASYEDIANSNWKEDANVLSEFRGAFSIAYADKSNCAFCTDRKGIEPWYYYHSEEDFIVSDSFWDIIQIIQPNYSMMNTSRVRESLLCPSVTGETPINGLNYLLPAYFVKYDSKDHSLQVEKYWDFKYSNEVTDVNDAVENMDRLFDETMASIKSKVGNCSFGMGISGGLDSRVVAHYAKKNQLNIIGFNVCVPKPNGVFKAKSIENARKIAQIFEIPYCDIAWDPKNIEGKIAEKIKRYPLGTGRNTFKYENNLPHFDVLLTGGSGELVGDYLPDGIENMTEEEFLSVMKKMFLSVSQVSSFSARASRAIGYLFGLKTDRTKKSSITLILQSEDFEKAESGLCEFVSNGRQKNQSNLEIYEDYLINILTARNRYGSFESLLGQKRSFSVYIPILFDEVLTWSPDMLHNRFALNELIIKKIPEVSNVNAETYITSPNAKNNVFKKFFALFGFLIRGNGTAIDQYWIKKRKIKKSLVSRLKNDCNWFADAFRIEKDDLAKMVLKSKETNLMINIWELKAFIDCLERKEYMKFDFAEKQ